jgi:hypothetical protein
VYEAVMAEKLIAAGTLKTLREADLQGGSALLASVGASSAMTDFSLRAFSH